MGDHFEALGLWRTDSFHHCAPTQPSLPSLFIPEKWKHGQRSGVLKDLYKGVQGETVSRYGSVVGSVPSVYEVLGSHLNTEKI